MIYIEQIILIDLLIHHILSFLTALVTLIYLSKLRLVLSDILNIIIIIFYFIYHIDIRWEMILIFLVSVITFRKKIVAILIYYFLNVALGGISSIIYFNFNYHWQFLFIILFIFLIFCLIYLFYYKGIPKRGLYYNCIIKGTGKHLFLYLDTGNKLYDNKNKPVIIINKRYVNYFEASNEIIEINTINGSSREVCFKCKKGLYIKFNRKYIHFEGSIILRDDVGDGIIGLNVLGG